MTLLQESTSSSSASAPAVASLRDCACDCDAPLRATSTQPHPFHRLGCRALTCPDCGQDRVSHPFRTDGALLCPDGLGLE